MHSYVLVEIPADATDVEAAVALALAPHCEVGPDGEHLENGFWDWYRIGGRWTGMLGIPDGQGAPERTENDVSLRGLIAEEHKPAILVTLVGGVFANERWNGVGFEDASGEFEDAWRSLSPNARLVVVDCHS